jgi:mRNA-degrading endonuclease RelE of RelBE toxin-antitoxin system
MEFLGIKPGKNISYNLDRYRPLGERVSISLTFKSVKTKKKITIPFEELLLDGKKTMQTKGFIYTASSWVTGTDKKKHLRADLSKFVVSAYNSSSTLFDNPRIVGTLDNNNDTQYGLNPKYTPLNKERIVITIKPTLPAGKSRVMLFDTKASVDKEGVIRLTTKIENGNLFWKNQTLAEFVAAHKKLDLKDKDTHLRLRIDDKFPVKYLAELGKKLSAMKWWNILREKGEPYVQSFYHPRFDLKRRAKAWMSVPENGRVPKRVRLYKKDGKILADAFGEVEYTADDLKSLMNHADYKFRNRAEVFIGLYDEFTYGELKPFFAAMPEQPHHYVHFIRRVPRIVLDPELPISVDGGAFAVSFTALSPNNIKRYRIMLMLPETVEETGRNKIVELLAWQNVSKILSKASKVKNAPKKIKLSPKIKLPKSGKYRVIIQIEDKKGELEKTGFDIIREKE